MLIPLLAMIVDGNYDHSNAHSRLANGKGEGENTDEENRQTGRIEFKGG